eukprot:CAMPEP_0171939120 /NCGR_PEP_ID=MMETSP0993-20121228/36043_1 /TAXON_ID=483369 /ORGANISM="non described non described, Strain CCMP2098" /LENGTH=59 /DNA_ID=CAMNT_0012580875 /DNA_START=584 /DNA_END=763 /DNA_ORIENTATION=+
MSRVARGIFALAASLISITISTDGRLNAEIPAPIRPPNAPPAPIAAQILSTHESDLFAI